MYKLGIPITREDNPSLPIIKKLFKNILGYTDDEIQDFVDINFLSSIAINVTKEQVAQIIVPFYYENHIQLFLKDNNGRIVSYKEAGVVYDGTTSYDYNKPILNRNQLVIPKNQKEIDTQENIEQNVSQMAVQNRIKETQIEKNNIPKCPTCGSTKVHPISAGKKAIGFALVGIFSGNFGKSYECDNCKYKW